VGVLKKLFILTAIAFPLGVAVRINLVPQVYVYPLDLVLIVFVIVGVYHQMAEHKFVYFKPLLFFLIACLISLIINFYWLSPHNFLVALLYLARVALFVQISSIIASLFTKKDARFFMLTLLAGLCITVVFGIVQYFFYPNLRNLIYAGWDEHLYRMFSTFLDPNFASAVFVICLWMGLGALQMVRHTYIRMGIFIMLGLTVISIFLTYSRTGFLMLIVSLLIFLIVEKKYILIGVAAFLFIVGIIVLPKNMHSEGVKLFRTASIFSRIQSYDTALKIYSQHPLFGVGFNTYRYAQEKQNIGGVAISESHAGAGVSNSYIFVLVTTGIVGLGFFLFMIYKIVREVLRINLKYRYIRNIVLAIITAVLVGSLTDNIFFYSFVMYGMFTVLGVIQLFMDDK
jgi:O-antigen ligase